MSPTLPRSHVVSSASSSPMTRTRSLALALCLTVAAGCGGAGRGVRHHASIEDLRARAAASPSDPDAQSALAEAELLLEGGDPERQRPAIDGALRLSPNSARLHFLSAVEHDTHGRLSSALDEHLRVLALVANDDDALARAMAEVSLATLADYDDSVPDFSTRVQAALEPLTTSPAVLGPAAFDAASSLLLELAHRRGDIDAVRALASAMGCVTEARVAGPFGPRALLGFDRELPPDAPGPLAAHYELGRAVAIARAARSRPAAACSRWARVPSAGRARPSWRPR